MKQNLKSIVIALAMTVVAPQSSATPASTVSVAECVKILSEEADSYLGTYSIDKITVERQRTEADFFLVRMFGRVILLVSPGPGYRGIITNYVNITCRPDGSLEEEFAGSSRESDR